MSYYSHVAVAFRKEDWYNIVVPELNKLTGDNAALYSEGESYLDDDTVIVRWDSVNHWQSTKLAKVLKKLSSHLECDYCEGGEDFVSRKLGGKEALGVIEKYNPYFRFPSEVGIHPLDVIARNLVKMLLEKGVSPDEIAARASESPEGYPFFGAKSQLLKYVEEVTQK